MKRVLFLIHGMGETASSWSDDVISEIKTSSGQYNYFKNNPIDDASLQIVPISYFQIFKTYLKQWNNQASQLNSFIKANQIMLPVDITSWLNNCNPTEADFFWSHVSHVLLYRFFPIVAAQVRTSVMRDIVQTLTQAGQGGEMVKASFMAFSLGTSVGHDALAELGTQGINGNQAFLTSNFYFDNIIMLANVSEILRTEWNPEDANSSVVHPMSVVQGTAYCEQFFNVRHIWDPIPAPDPFAPQNWGNDLTRIEDLNHLHNIKDTSSLINIHGFAHYFDHPKTHIPVLNAIFGPVINSAETQTAIANYPQFTFTSALQTEVQNFTTSLDNLVKSINAGASDPMALLKYGVQFYAACKNFTENLSQLD